MSCVRSLIYVLAHPDPYRAVSACLQAPLKVGNEYITVSITVLESNDMEFLFGLDMLRRHQCSLDLKRNVLTFGSLDNTELPFLAEHELPKSVFGIGSDESEAGAGPGSSKDAVAAPPNPGKLGKLPGAMRGLIAMVYKYYKSQIVLQEHVCTGRAAGITSAGGGAEQQRCCHRPQAEHISP